MIDKTMAQYSNKCLVRLFKQVKQKGHIGLMGGWAIHYLLKGKGIEHIGSRDIDIFFNPQKVSLGRVKRLIESEGFKPHSTFRWAKFIHRSTGREMSSAGAGKVPQYDLCVVFVDVAAPKHPDKRVMNQLLLRKVFRGESKRIKLDGVRVMVPSEKVMAEMKLSSAGERGDRFKKSKDIADLFMLLYNKPRLLKATDKKLRKGFKLNLEGFRISGNLADASTMIGVPTTVILRTLNKL